MVPLDIILGLISVYLTLSLVVTALGEGLVTWWGLKARTARKIVNTLIGDEWGERFYRHPAIQRLTQEPQRKQGKARDPSYIPPELFVDTLLSLAATEARGGGADTAFAPTPMSTGEVHRVLDGLATTGSNPELAGLLQEKLERAEFDLARFRASLIAWFDHTGDRSYGWYRRELGLWLFAASVLVATVLNADTIQMYSRISADPALRAQLVEQAEQMADSGKTTAPPTACAVAGLQPGCSASDVLRETSAELLPVLGGQSVFAEATSRDGEPAFLGWLAFKLIGLLLTAAAISLGAPFWFDLLRKVVQLRGAIASGGKGGSAADSATAPGVEGDGGGGPAPAALSTVRRRAIDSGKLATLDGFEYQQYGFSRVNLLWCARCSGASYLDRGAVEEQVQTAFGARGRLVEKPAADGNPHDTQVLLVLHPRLTVLAFRGTEDKLADWGTDIDIELVRQDWIEDDTALVHSGFATALESIWGALLEVLDEEGVLNRNHPVWLTGHSLGGGLATLAALRLRRELSARDSQALVAGLHTFGQPRAGNPSLARLLDRELGTRYLRSINNRDIVPRVPLPRTPDVLSALQGGDLEVHDYAHGGRVLYFNDLGRAIMDPPLWYRALDVMPIAASREALREKLRESTADHAIDGYIQAHATLLDEGV